MPGVYEITLTNNWKAFLLLIGGLFAVVAGCLAAGRLTDGLDKTGELVVFLGLFGAGLFGIYRAVKKWSGQPVVVAITSQSLVVQYLDTGWEEQMPFDGIASYYYSNFNSGEVLRLRLHDGRRVKLAVNTNFHSGQKFPAMVQELELAMAQHAQAGQRQAVPRERTFFEKPVSTAVMVAFSAAVAWLVWLMATSDRPVSGSAISSLGAYIAFAAAWLAAAKRRNEKD